MSQITLTILFFILQLSGRKLGKRCYGLVSRARKHDLADPGHGDSSWRLRGERITAIKMGGVGVEGEEWPEGVLLWKRKGAKNKSIMCTCRSICTVIFFFFCNWSEKEFIGKTSSKNEPILSSARISLGLWIGAKNLSCKRIAPRRCFRQSFAPESSVGVWKCSIRERINEIARGL